MKLELPERKKLVHSARMPIRWGDMDAMGHVNNTVYFRYLEVARIDWFAAIKCPLNPQGEGALIVNAFCNFHKQLEYPGDIVVKMYASDPGRSSFETWATIEREDDPGVVYASGGATTVWLDFRQQKSSPLPAWLRSLLEDGPAR
ncbi:acyl-CoA thioesterase [Ramlibacter sp. G-1-2-2]|uniref:Acyl-CoA thioesterase n=1 Tax=Ramlibacter agri TaxID=2728837 RepID=A0A848HFT5_9BURK|nr:thioesterase family protein [Ramlibacter agri]NML46478.1 acyl-CoA thioesterase [Ramlibacter agri]